MSIAHLAARLRITPNCANYYHWVRLLTEFPQCLSAPGWYRAAITGGFPQPGRLAGIDTLLILKSLVDVQLFLLIAFFVNFPLAGIPFSGPLSTTYVS